MNKNSQRVYPEKKCKNSKCDFGGVFTPHDRRQLYCCKQCGTNNRNDKRHDDDATIYFEERFIRKNDKALEEIYMEQNKAGSCLVSLSELRLYKVNLKYYVRPELNGNTGMPILWLYKFGTEVHKENADWIYIHKRPMQK